MSGVGAYEVKHPGPLSFPLSCVPHYTFTNQTTVGSVPSVLLTNITSPSSCMERLITFALTCSQIATGCVTI